MTLLKELMESSNWEDDVYGINAITLINNKKIGIQGPVSYEEYVDEFSELEAKDIKGFHPGTWFVTYTETGSETNDFNRNMKIFTDIDPAEKEVVKLKKKFESVITEVKNEYSILDRFEMALNSAGFDVSVNGNDIEIQYHDEVLVLKLED